MWQFINDIVTDDRWKWHIVEQSIKIRNLNDIIIIDRKNIYSDRNHNYFVSSCWCHSLEMEYISKLQITLALWVHVCTSECRYNSSIHVDMGNNLIKTARVDCFFYCFICFELVHLDIHYILYHNYHRSIY